MVVRSQVEQGGESVSGGTRRGQVLKLGTRGGGGTVPAFRGCLLPKILLIIEGDDRGTRPLHSPY